MNESITEYIDERIAAALAARPALTVRDLPLAQLQSRLELDWLPDASVLLANGTTPNPIVVSALPSSPRDGTEVYYLASQALGILWHLKYRPDAASAYDWLFVGGSPLHSYVAATETTGSAAIADLATDGPTLTVPLAGDYMARFGARSQQNTAGQNARIHLSVSAVDVNQMTTNAATANNSDHLARELRRDAVAAAGVIKLRYSSPGGAGLAQFGNRFLSLLPVRVG